MTTYTQTYTELPEHPDLAVASNFSVIPLTGVVATLAVQAEVSVLTRGGLTATSTSPEARGTELAKGLSQEAAANAEAAPGYGRAAVPEYSEAYRRLRARQALRQARESLVEFSKMLDRPEAAFWIANFRSSLEDLWKVLPADRAPVAHAVAAIQATIRFNKWNSFAPPEVAMLSRCIELIAPLDITPRDAQHIYSVLRSGHLDVFPSAPERAYEDNDTDALHEADRGQ
jgi:hypothetical protein